MTDSNIGDMDIDVGLYNTSSSPVTEVQEFRKVMASHFIKKYNKKSQKIIRQVNFGYFR